MVFLLIFMQIRELHDSRIDFTQRVALYNMIVDRTSQICHRGWGVPRQFLFQHSLVSCTRQDYY